MIKIGSHVSFSKGRNYLLGAGKESEENNANAMMIYLGAPQNTKRAKPEEYNLEQYKKEYEQIIPIKNIVIHAPYIVNPSSKINYKFAEEFLIKEIERMNYIGAKYIVVHPGAYTKFDKDESIKILTTVLNKILDKTKDATILLETMSGKGSEIGAKFEELSFIISNIKQKERIGICLDTCHLWEAGYDIKNFDIFINELKKHKLLHLVEVIHVNDSKNDLGAKKDRHENIGKGFIGLKALQKIVQCPEFKNAIKILETPIVNGKSLYKNEIKLLINKL